MVTDMSAVVQSLRLMMKSDPPVVHSLRPRTAQLMDSQRAECASLGPTRLTLAMMMTTWDNPPT